MKASGFTNRKIKSKETKEGFLIIIILSEQNGLRVIKRALTLLDVKSRVQQELCNPLLGAALRPACFLPCLLCQNLRHHRPHSGLVLLLGQLTAGAGGGKVSLTAKKRWSSGGKAGREARMSG